MCLSNLGFQRYFYAKFNFFITVLYGTFAEGIKSCVIPSCIYYDNYNVIYKVILNVGVYMVTSQA